VCEAAKRPRNDGAVDEMLFRPTDFDEDSLTQNLLTLAPDF